MLLEIADALETSVNVLLAETVEPDVSSELKVLANKLEIINEQIVKHNESRRKTWRVIFVAASILSVCILIGNFVCFIYLQTVIIETSTDTAIIGGADGPTAILISETVFKPLPFVITLIVAAVSVIGIYKTRKK